MVFLVEQAAKETTEELAEAGAKKTAKELAEAAAKKKADDVGKVVTKKKRKPRQPTKDNKNIDHSKTTRNPDGSTTYYDKDGNPVTYNKDGYPDFSDYSEAEFEVPNMDGTSNDFSKVYKKMMEEYGFKSQKEAKDWLKKEGLTPHHNTDGKSIQLVDSVIHDTFPHSGGASILRN